MDFNPDSWRRGTGLSLCAVHVCWVEGVLVWVLLKALFSVLIQVAGHTSVCLRACWEYVPSHLATGCTWGHGTVAAFHLGGTGEILEWEGSPWVPKPLRLVTSNSIQLQSTSYNTHWCWEELYRSATHCWLLFFLNHSPPTLFDSPWFMSQKRQWNSALVSSLCASNGSAPKQCSEKAINQSVEGSPQNRALWESPPAFCSELQLW